MMMAKYGRDCEKDRKATQSIKEGPVESEDCEPPKKKIKVEALTNEESTGSSLTPHSQSEPNKDDDDDWMGEVLIVKDKGNPDDKLDSEIDTYCNTANIGREEDSLKWWAERESLFPCLNWVAKKYLAIPALSVPSERIFSLAGNIVSKKSLNPENVDMLIFLKKYQ